MEQIFSLPVSPDLKGYPVYERGSNREGTVGGRVYLHVQEDASSPNGEEWEGVIQRIVQLWREARDFFMPKELEVRLDVIWRDEHTKDDAMSQMPLTDILYYRHPQLSLF